MRAVCDREKRLGGFLIKIEEVEYKREEEKAGRNIFKEQFVILNAPPSDNVSCFVLSDANGESFCRLAAPNLAILD